jgi:hypothetical protein
LLMTAIDQLPGDLSSWFEYIEKRYIICAI